MRLPVELVERYTFGSYVVEPADATELICGLTWDSREVSQGDCYVALVGERVDGHRFVEQALRSGARCVLVSSQPTDQAIAAARELGAAIVMVKEGSAAIADLARSWRNHLTGRIIGLTGSVGKTTTKSLVRDVLAAQFSVVATKANQNNEIGVPKTILNADPETEVVVVEMGMRGLGQIRDLCDIVRPEWGVITLINGTHMELLGTQENIMRAKAELFEALPSETGRAFVNGDDVWQQRACEVASLPQRGVAQVAYNAPGEDGPRAWAKDVVLDDEGCPGFTLCLRGFDVEFEQVPCKLSLRGLHNVGNALAAIAVGKALGMSTDLVVAACRAAQPEAGRQTVCKSAAGVTLIDDAYNANPDSMRAALSLMRAMNVPGRRVAVLGDMGELGDDEVACHRGVGAAAAELGIDLLVCVGDLARHIASAARDAGMDDARVVCTSTTDEALDLLNGYLKAGDCVLAKASHFMELGRVIEGLMK